MLCLRARLFIDALWSPAGKGLTSWLSFVMSNYELSLSHWYPGSGVVLDLSIPDLCSIIYFIYTIFQEGNTFGMKAILPCGPLNIKHMENKQYTYIQIANTNSEHCLSYRYYLKYETINMFSCLCCIPGTGN